MAIRDLIRMPGVALNDGPYLIIGLGNVGPKYGETRHNVGFMALDVFSESLNGESFTAKPNLKAHVLETSVDGQKIILAKPTTQMNLSGLAVSKLQSYFNVIDPRILVIYDDVDIAFGTIRSRVGGGNAGHNGVKSIEKVIGDGFARIRIGVKNKQHERIDTKDFVLKPFSASEFKQLDDVLIEASKLIDAFINEQFEPTSISI